VIGTDKFLKDADYKWKLRPFTWKVIEANTLKEARMTKIKKHEYTESYT
jgi:hypothetical protein